MRGKNVEHQATDKLLTFVLRIMTVHIFTSFAKDVVLFARFLFFITFARLCTYKLQVLAIFFVANIYSYNISHLSRFPPTYELLIL